MMMTLVSCTKVAPPVSAGLSMGDLGPPKPTPPKSEMELSKLQDGIRIGVKGPDAEILYQLMAIEREQPSANESFAPESNPNPVTPNSMGTKVGRDFKCMKDASGAICEVIVTFSGAVNPIREEEKVLKGAPGCAQAEFGDELIAVAPPAQSGKVKLKVTGAQARSMFEDLSLEETGLPAVEAGRSPGSRKIGERIQCVRNLNESTADVQGYKCEMGLDLNTGTVDKVQADQVD